MVPVAATVCTTEPAFASAVVKTRAAAPSLSFFAHAVKKHAPAVAMAKMPNVYLVFTDTSPSCMGEINNFKPWLLTVISG